MGSVINGTCTKIKVVYSFSNEHVEFLTISNPYSITEKKEKGYCFILQKSFPRKNPVLNKESVF